MLTQVPLTIDLIFIALVILCYYVLYRWLSITGMPMKSKMIIMGLCLMIIVGLSLSSYQLFFASALDAVPPRFLLVATPALGLIILAFFLSNIRSYFRKIPLTSLTWFHTIRIIVESLFFVLVGYEVIPQIMCFTGRNFDILAGLTAPLAVYFFISKDGLKRKALIIWNILCLLLLSNIIITAVLSTPTAIQQMGFDQPNILVLHFPFVLLPGFVVPMVILSHLVALDKLWNREEPMHL